MKKDFFLKIYNYKYSGKTVKNQNNYGKKYDINGAVCVQTTNYSMTMDWMDCPN